MPLRYGGRQGFATVIKDTHAAGGQYRILNPTRYRARKHRQIAQSKYAPGCRIYGHKYAKNRSNAPCLNPH